MHRIDEIFTECPFYGSRKIREALRREGFEIGRERVQAFMRRMGLRAIYPRAKISKKHPEHKIYPFLSVKNSLITETFLNRFWITSRISSFSYKALFDSIVILGPFYFYSF